MMKTISALSLASTLLFSQVPVCASGSEGSDLASQGTAMVLSGSAMALAGSAQVVVESIQTAGESSILVLKSVPDMSTTTIRVSAAGLHDSGLAAGKSIRVVTHSTGTLLIFLGEVIAIIPNKIGKALLYHAEH